MKLRVETAALRDALSAVAPLCTSKVRESLRCCRLRTTTSGELRVAGTDLQTAIEERLERVDVDRHGEALVDCSRLLAVARVAVGDDLALEEQGGTLSLASARDRWELPTLLAEDYPEVPTPTVNNAAAIDCAVLATVLAAATAAADPQEGVRYSLDCVRLVAEDGDLTAEATDGKRLLRYRVDLREPTSERREWLVLAKALQVIARSLGSGTAYLHGGGEARPTRLHLSLPQGCCSTLLANTGGFPDCDTFYGMLDEEPIARLYGDAGDLAAAVRRLSVLAVQEGKGDQRVWRDAALVDVDSDGARAQIRVPSALSQGWVPLPLRVEIDGEVHTSFAAHRLLGVLTPIDGPVEIRLLSRGTEKPAVLLANDERLVQFLMPLERD